MELLEGMIIFTLLFTILKWLIVIIGIIVALYFIIRAICRYQARQNAEAFNYDLMATRTAEEICRRMMIIEKQKAEADKSATTADENQNTRNRTGAPEQIGSQQA